MEFIEITQSNCLDSNNTHYFIFTDHAGTEHIGIGAGTSLMDGTTEVTMYHSTLPGGYAQEIDLNHIVAVSVKPFTLPTTEAALQSFNKLDFNTPLAEGCYFIVSTHQDFDYDIDNDGLPIGAPNGEESHRVSLGWICNESDPELPPMTFEGFTELSGLPSDESYLMTHYLKFEWPNTKDNSPLAAAQD